VNSIADSGVKIIEKAGWYVFISNQSAHKQGAYYRRNPLDLIGDKNRVKRIILAIRSELHYVSKQVFKRDNHLILLMPYLSVNLGAGDELQCSFRKLFIP
jgi:hypothetical protein